MTILTIAYNNTTVPEEFGGNISDLYSSLYSIDYNFDSIRLVKTGAGTLILDTHGNSIREERNRRRKDRDGKHLRDAGRRDRQPGSQRWNSRSLRRQPERRHARRSGRNDHRQQFRIGQYDADGRIFRRFYRKFGDLPLVADATNPCLFAGVIENGPNKTLALTYQGNGVMTLTGHNTFTGGIEVYSGWLQVGDGASDSASADCRPSLRKHTGRADL